LNQFRAILTISLLMALNANPGAAHEGKISGYMFGDYYSVLSSDDDAGAKNRNAFEIRRIYFTYNRKIGDDFSIRFRLEAKGNKFGAGGSMVPFVKHAYLKWKEGLGSADFYFGLSGTPTFAAAEKAWKYRAIEKTMLDLNKIGSSADLGVALKGKAGKLGYHVMLGNGMGKAPERDNGKKIYASGSVQLSDGLQIELYGDFNMRRGGHDEITLKGVAGFISEGFHGGLEVFSCSNKKAATGGGDQTITGLSAFGALKLGESLKGFGRVDAKSNDKKAATDGGDEAATDGGDEKETHLLVIAGLDHQLAKNVHLMPNLYIKMPDGQDPNIQARLTFFYKF